MTKQKLNSVYSKLAQSSQFLLWFSNVQLENYDTTNRNKKKYISASQDTENATLYLKAIKSTKKTQSVKNIVHKINSFFLSSKKILYSANEVSHIANIVSVTTNGQIK